MLAVCRIDATTIYLRVLADHQDSCIVSLNIMVWTLRRDGSRWAGILRRAAQGACFAYGVLH
jgi:hypothetical protein